MTASIILGEPQEFGPIEVWPLIAPGQTPQEWGWGLGNLEVGEALIPVPNVLHLANAGAAPVFLPVGFLIGGLRQSRMVAEDVVLREGESREISVLCVEAGRFHAPKAAQQAGRAPLSVMLAGLVATHGAPGAPQQNRQASVWDSVSRHEQRSGTRPTHSLTQVMAEDGTQRVTQQCVEADLRERLNLHPEQVGVIAAVAGQPLVMETFGSHALAKAHIADMIRGLAFDADGIELGRSSSRNILEFVEQARSPETRATLQPSGTLTISGLDDHVLIHGISAGPHEQLHLMAVNRRHPLLQGAAV